MRKNYNSLPREEQIKQIKKENVFLVIFSIIMSIVHPVLSYYLWDRDIELAIGFLIAWPVSIFFGGVYQIRDNNRKIKSLQIEMKDEETK